MLKRREKFFGEDNKFMRRRMKRTTKQYIIVAFICIFVLGGAAAFTAIVVTSQIRDKYATQLSDVRKDMEANKKTVYIASADIMTGDYITTDNVAAQTVYATQPAETYITADDIGKVALINISTGTQVLKSMLSGNLIDSELREVEYTVINISTNIVNNDTVDVRIFYPNGESYVVLSKKIIKGYAPGATTCFFWLDEEELLRMSAAIVDAGLYAGSNLYVTKYIEPNIQAASVANYTPSLSILSLLESDPNILDRVTQELSKDVRKSLENRLADSLDTDVSTISWDVNPNVQSNQITTPAPTPGLAEDSTTDTQPITQQNNPTSIPEDGKELGNADSKDNYFYYTEEETAKEDDVEYGE